MGTINHTHMEIKKLVSPIPRDVSESPTALPSDKYLLVDTRESSSSDHTRSLAISHLDCIRNSLQSKGLTISLIYIME